MFNALPTRFRHYEVQKLLGSGGFGAVYLARDTHLKRLVVLKTLHAHLAAQPAMVTRFLREAQAMARLDHANIVRVNRVEHDPQMPFFEMEYVEGQTLADYRRGRVLPLPEAMPYLAQMAAALDAAHQRKMVHRDVKPANVLIKPDGTLKLTDFGIIKLLEPIDLALPSTREIIGTPSYMAPEQVDIDRKGEIGPATDIYALGIVAYQLLTGHLPFSGAPAIAIYYAHANTPPPDPRQFNRYLPAPVAQVLLQALDKQPRNRYASAMSFVEALERAALGSNVPPPPTTRPPTVPVVTDFGTATSNNGPTIAQPSKIAWPMIVGLLMVCIIALLLRPFIFPQDPPSVEPPVVLATETPAEPTEAPAPTEAPEPTEAPAAPTEAPEPTQIPIEPTQIPIEPTAIPPTAIPTLGIGSTMPGQDGMTLLYVPAGEFLRGSKEDDPDADSDEHPQRSIYLDGFWIDETEVSNEMFVRFVEETAYQTDAEKEGTGRVCADGSCDDTEGADWQHPQGLDSSTEGLEQHPVVQVSWNDAKAYCEWAGRRLPTEAEWEKTARGIEGQTYPWGNEDIAGNRVNFCDNNCSWSWADNNIDDGHELTAPVGTYPDGASPYGAFDMAGNVWEWTADFYDAEYYNDAPERNPQGPDTGDFRVLRGGSWSIVARRVRAGYRARIGPARRFDLYGFRCAVSP